MATLFGSLREKARAFLFRESRSRKGAILKFAFGYAALAWAVLVGLVWSTHLEPLPYLGLLLLGLAAASEGTGDLLWVARTGRRMLSALLRAASVLFMASFFAVLVVGVASLP